jgi:uncharacterized protein YkwD
MNVKVQRSRKRRFAVLLAAALVAMAATACFPNTSPNPPADPVDNAVFQAMNANRVAAGVPAMQWSPKLANTAGKWSANESTVNSMYHQDLSALLYSSDYNGWSTLGENLLVGPGNMSATDMETAWMNSPAHRANIMNGSFDAVGVGHVWGPDGRIWVVVDFGGI